MDKFTGLLTKIRLLKDKPFLARFTLVTDEGNINCIVAKDWLSKQLFMLPEDKYTVRVTGHFNKRNQLVIGDMHIVNRDRFIDDLGL